MGKSISIDLQKAIVNLYEVNDRLTQAEIARILGVSKTTVSRYLFLSGVEKKRRGCIPVDTQEQIVLAYREKKLTQVEISKAFGIPQSSISLILRRTDDRPKKMGPKKTLLSDRHLSQITRLYNCGVTVNRIAEALGSTRAVIRRVITQDLNLFRPHLTLSTLPTALPFLEARQLVIKKKADYYTVFKNGVAIGSEQSLRFLINRVLLSEILNEVMGK